MTFGVETPADPEPILSEYLMNGVDANMMSIHIAVAPSRIWDFL